MYVRIKTTPNSPRKSVQIVQSVRRGNKVAQKIVRHVGIALNDDELGKLKLLAESIRVKMESEGKDLLYSPEEIARLSLGSRKTSSKKAKTEEGAEKEKAVDKASDYDVNLQDLIEEGRVIRGIHEVYGRKIRFAFPSNGSSEKIYHLLKIPTLSSPKIIAHL